MSTGVCTIETELLRRFTNPEHETFRDIINNGHYRGDCTETGDRRRRLELGEALYEHVDWDTVVCTGSICLFIPRYKHPEGVEKRSLGVLTAPHYWAMSQVEERHPDISPASPRMLKKISATNMEALKQLPDLELLEVPWVYFYSTGRKGQKRKKAPQDVVYLRFAGGVGVVALLKPVTKEKGAQAA